MRPARGLALWLSMVAAGCGWGDSDGEVNPTRRGPSRPLSRAPTAPAQPNLELPSSGPVAEAQDQEHVLKAPPAPILAVQPEAEPEKEKRDLGRELRAAVGMPTDCLQPRTATDAPPKVVVDVEAHFVETGLATRAYVRAGQLAEEELACLQKRVAAARLSAPIEPSPQAVHTTLEFTFAAPKTP